MAAGLLQHVATAPQVQRDDVHGLATLIDREPGLPGDPVGGPVPGAGLAGVDGRVGDELGGRAHDPRGARVDDDRAVHLAQLAQAGGGELDLQREAARGQRLDALSWPRTISAPVRPRMMRSSPSRKLGAGRDLRQCGGQFGVDAANFMLRDQWCLAVSLGAARTRRGRSASRAARGRGPRPALSDGRARSGMAINNASQVGLPVLRVRVAAAAWVGRCGGVPGLGCGRPRSGGGSRRGRAAGPVTAAALTDDPDRPGRGRAATPTGVRRAGPGPGRWAGPGSGDPAGGGAGRGEVDAAAAGRRGSGARGSGRCTSPGRRASSRSGPAPSGSGAVSPRSSSRRSPTWRRGGPCRGGEPGLLVVDSIQTIRAPGVEGVAPA